MEKILKAGNTYDLFDIISRKDTDHNKYEFVWTSDYCWENEPNLDKYYKEDNYDKFVEEYNKIFCNSGDYDYHMNCIINMHGSGAGWPEVEFSTRLMTIKSLIEMYRYEFLTDIIDGVVNIHIYKVEEAND